MAGAWHPNVPVQWTAIIQATNIVNGRGVLGVYGWPLDSLSSCHNE